MENDDVVTKALASWKGSDDITVAPQLQQLTDEPTAAVPIPVHVHNLLQTLAAKQTQHGYIVLPDQACSGPMYVSIIHKH